MVGFRLRGGVKTLTPALSEFLRLAPPGPSNTAREALRSAFPALFPSQEDADADLTRWFLETSQLPPFREAPPTMTNEQASRLRWRGTNEFPSWGDSQGRPWTLYLMTQPPAFVAEFRQRFLPVIYNLSPPDRTKALKQLGGLFKIHQSGLSKYWKHYVDTHLLTDFQPAKPITEFVADIEDWVTGQVTHTIAGSRTRFLADFADGVEDFLARGPGTGYRHISVNTFLDDPNHWARSGTSDSERLHVLVGGKVVRARKSKWATALAITRQQLGSLFWARTKQRNKAIQKRELGKVRAIIAGDLGTYLNMAYVGRYVTSRLAGHPNSTLFYRASQLVDLWERMASDSLDPDTIKMPVDQEGFDHQVDMDMIAIVNAAFHKLIDQEPDPAARAELHAVLRHIEFRLDGGTVTVGGKTIRITKGILSGWAWTALYDTIINAGELHAMRKRGAEISGQCELRDWNVQGDDDRTLFSGWKDAASLWTAYTEAQFSVNPSKFFIRTDSDEYLRQVGFAGSTTGYPARACPTLVWRNPVSREPAPGEERMRESITSWNQYFNRSGRESWSLALADVAGATRQDIATITHLARSPTTVGGLGLEWAEGPWLAVTKATACPEWRWQSTPPLARGLAQEPITAPEIAKQWMANVEVRGGVRWSAFEVSAAGSELIWAGWAPGQGAKLPMQARADPDTQPTLSAAKLSAATTREQVLNWIDPAMLPTEASMYQRLSRGAYWAWVRGELPFRTPVVPGHSGLQTGHVSSTLAKFCWARALSRRLGGRGIRRAALTAEHLTRTVLKYKVRLGG